jgi:hypothetical protein
MPTTQIQVTAADNELILIASTPAGSSELLRTKSGYHRPVNITLHPGTILPAGDYSLTMIGVNWGGPSAYTVVVTTDGTPRTYQGGGNTSPGVVWSQTIPMSVVAGQ